MGEIKRISFFFSLCRLVSYPVVNVVTFSLEDTYLSYEEKKCSLGPGVKTKGLTSNLFHQDSDRTNKQVI